MRCPTDHELRDFSVGEVSVGRLETLAGHVEGCATCEATLAGLEGGADELVRGLRGAGSAERTDAVPGELVDAARGVRSPRLVFDHGRRFALDLAEGTCRLGRFELIEELGVGSFGHVFKAHDTELDRIVAVKVRRGLAADDAEEKERFLREARSAAQLKHPGIVAVHEAGETDEGVCYLVTEYVQGRTLEERVRADPPGFEEAALLVAEVADALHDAHTHGVVHRDVKPSNVMLDESGRAHVMDFGLAKREVGEITVTSDGRVMGTPAYMSPELARGDAHRAGPATDVYSLGVVLYELLTGERPFQAGRRLLLLQVLEDDPRPPRRLRSEIPRDLETICQKAMSKTSARRYASARELADDLRRWTRGEPILARPVGRFGRLQRWCRRNKLAAALFAVVLTTSAFGFWHLSRTSGEVVRSTALDAAAQYAELLQTVNDMYSSEVVARAGEHGVRATADYATREGAIPLPATLLAELLACISQGETGMSGRQYSEYPFRGREHPPLDSFERDALAHLMARPDEPFVRFEDLEGRPVVRRATARLMQASCVECHNNHPDSTKTDWRVGELRGVLEIIRPLDRDEARVRAGLRTSFLLVALLLAVAGSALVLAGRRRLGGAA
jgi:hypothetical protein